jgi:hypothetical protein
MIVNHVKHLALLLIMLAKARCSDGYQSQMSLV